MFDSEKQPALWAQADEGMWCESEPESGLECSGPRALVSQK